MLVLIGIDIVSGTSLHKLALDWIATIKITAFGTCLFWGLLILAPATLIARLLRSWPSPRIDPWAGGILTKQLVRPIVGALAFYGAALVGPQVWNHLPRIERGPPQPGLLAALEDIVQSAIRGDPEATLVWVS